MRECPNCGVDNPEPVDNCEFCRQEMGEVAEDRTESTDRTDLLRCGVLGCENVFPREEKRVYRLAMGHEIVCCPECWEAMELPRELRDTKELEGSDGSG